MKKLILLAVMAVASMSAFAGLYGVDAGRGISNCSSEINIDEPWGPFDLLDKDKYDGCIFRLYAECTSSGSSTESPSVCVTVKLRNWVGEVIKERSASAGSEHVRDSYDLILRGDEYLNTQTFEVTHKIFVPSGIYGSIRTNLLICRFTYI